MFPQHPIFLSVSNEDEEEEERGKKRNRRIQKARKASNGIILSNLQKLQKVDPLDDFSLFIIVYCPIAVSGGVDTSQASVSFPLPTEQVRSTLPALPTLWSHLGQAHRFVCLFFLMNN